MPPEIFNPTDPATWTARGRSPAHADALARAWRDYPDLPPQAPAEARMARTRERVAAMRPVTEDIQRAAEAARQARNFAFLEGKLAADGLEERDAAILQGRERHNFDWDAAVCYSQGWYAAHAGWPYRSATHDGGHAGHQTAYDCGFRDAGGEPSDLFDAARRRNLAAERTFTDPRPAPASLTARPLPSTWLRPSDQPRPVRWSRRLLLITSGSHLVGTTTGGLINQIRARPGARALNIVVLTAEGFVRAEDEALSAEPLSPSRCAALAADRQQTTRLRELVEPHDLEDILVAADGDALSVIDAHAAALPLCRAMERTRNSVLQQRAHLTLWLDRAVLDGDNAGAGHIRWGKVAKGLTGKLGEFTARYAGKAEDGKGHVLVIELAGGAPAMGFATSDGRRLNPRIAFANKARLRREMTVALRTFGGATRLAPRRLHTAA